MSKHRESSGGGTGEAKSTKVDSPDAPAEVKTADHGAGATFPGVGAQGPAASDITAKVDPASGVVYPETNQPVDPTFHPNLGATGPVGPGSASAQERMPNEETPKNPDGTAKGPDVGVFNDPDPKAQPIGPTTLSGEPAGSAAMPRPLDTEGRMPNEETPKTADGKAKIAGGDLKRFRVTFNPPSPVGDRARSFDCEARDGSDALAQWRAYTGFAGDLAVQPIITEVVE